MTFGIEHEETDFVLIEDEVEAEWDVDPVDMETRDAEAEPDEK